MCACNPRTRTPFCSNCAFVLSEKLKEATDKYEILIALIRNDAYAMSFQSMGQYRSALLKFTKIIKK